MIEPGDMSDEQIYTLVLKLTNSFIEKYNSNDGVLLL